MQHTLDGIAVGETARISALAQSGDIRRRLMELGFIPGAVIRALHRSPFGGATAYGVCGAVIALRSADAEKILIK